LVYPLMLEAFAGDKAGAVAMGVLAMIFVIFMHRENLKRLWRNEESKLDFSKFKKKKHKAPEADAQNPQLTDTPDEQDEKEQEHD